MKLRVYNPTYPGITHDFGMSWNEPLMNLRTLYPTTEIKIDGERFVHESRLEEVERRVTENFSVSFESDYLDCDYDYDDAGCGYGGCEICHPTPPEPEPMPVSISDFAVGDVVEVVEVIQEEPEVGSRGTVVKINTSYGLHVRFDCDFRMGHSCSGLMENKRGRYFSDSDGNLQAIRKVTF